jgi:hypothetical protein
MNILAISKIEAAAKNLRPLAGPYRSTETEMMLRVIRDMRAGNIPHAVVDTSAGLEVWRSNNGWKCDVDQHDTAE